MGVLIMTTANLGLSTSTVGSDTGADASTREQTNINLLDLHDHTSGKGVKVPTGGININADLTFAGNSATSLKSIKYTSQVSDVAVANTLFVKNNELYYVDGSLNVVQITSGGAVSVASLISGNVFLDGGNQRGANVRLGTKDAYSFFFETNNTDRFSINSSGFMSFLYDWGFSPTVNSSTGSLDDVSSSGTSYLQFTGAGSVTVTGLANGTSGKTLLISNQTGSGITIKNESTSSSASNRIQTGTGNDISLADKASAVLIYNSTASRWSLLTGAATAATLTYPVGNVAANDSDVTFTNADNRAQVCTPTAARTYTLPTTSISAGDKWYFNNTSTTDGRVITLNASGGGTVAKCYPTGTTILIAKVATPTAASDWLVVSNTSSWVSWTPTAGAGFGTITAEGGFYRIKDNTEAEFRGGFTSGIAAAYIASISLPSTVPLNSTYLTRNTSTTANTGNIVGTYGCDSAANFSYIVTSPGTSTTDVYVAYTMNSASNMTPANGNGVATSTSLITFQFSIPI